MIVTGASSGIGRAAALRFAEEGVNVVVVDVNTEDGEQTVEDIQDAGGEATFVETDVSERTDVEAMVEKTVETCGGLDFAVNNAGIEGDMYPTADQPIDNWERVIDINLKGVFLGIRAELPAMLKHGGGAIVNISSTAGEVGFPGVARMSRVSTASSG